MTATDKQLVFVAGVLASAWLVFGVTVGVVAGRWEPLLGGGLSLVLICGGFGLLRLAECLFPTDTQERR